MLGGETPLTALVYTWHLILTKNAPSKSCRHENQPHSNVARECPHKAQQDAGHDQREHAVAQDAKALEEGSGCIARGGLTVRLANAARQKAWRWKR